MKVESSKCRILLAPLSVPESTQNSLGLHPFQCVCVCVCSCVELVFARVKCRCIRNAQGFLVTRSDTVNNTNFVRFCEWIQIEHIQNKAILHTQHTFTSHSYNNPINNYYYFLAKGNIMKPTNPVSYMKFRVSVLVSGRIRFTNHAWYIVWFVYHTRSNFKSEIIIKSTAKLMKHIGLLEWTPIRWQQHRENQSWESKK